MPGRAAALWFLPESPRWLVVDGQLDTALAVIHQVYTKEKLPLGGALQQADAVACAAVAICACACLLAGLRAAQDGRRYADNAPGLAAAASCGHSAAHVLGRRDAQPGGRAGVQESTAEVEHELLELWSSVEKDKDARRELAAATHVARQAQRHGKGRHHKQVGTLACLPDCCWCLRLQMRWQLWPMYACMAGSADQADRQSQAAPARCALS